MGDDGRLTVGRTGTPLKLSVPVGQHAEPAGVTLSPSAAQHGRRELWLYAGLVCGTCLKN
jgi:hypothetical protein